MVYFGIAVFLVYIIPVLIKYGIPKSLSETYYTPIGNLGFVAEMLLLGFFMMPALIDVYPHCISFFACVLLCFVGASPYSDKPVHSIIAASAGILSQIIVAITCPYLLLGWIGVGILTAFQKDKWLFWVELWCILSIFTLCLIM